MHHRFARSAANIAIVSESVAEDPNVLIARRFRILHLDIQLHPYKLHLTQQRRRYVEWVLEQQAVDANFSNTEFSSAMKNISHSMSILMNKIIVFEVLRILK